jgi:hypothetical protein
MITLFSFHFNFVFDNNKIQTTLQSEVVTANNNDNNEER